MGPDLENFSNHGGLNPVQLLPPDNRFLGHSTLGDLLGPRETPNSVFLGPLTLLHHLQQPLLDEVLPALPAGHLLLQGCNATQTSGESQAELSISGPTPSPGQGHLQFRKRAVKQQVTVGQGATGGREVRKPSSLIKQCADHVSESRALRR